MKVYMGNLFEDVCVVWRLFCKIKMYFFLFFIWEYGSNL